MFDIDDWIIVDGDKIVVVDRDGYKLWNKYKWNYSLSIRQLYRTKFVRIDNRGRRVYRVIRFWVELLGFPKPRNICFYNGDKLDLRRKNLINFR
jgi:hypothetical protein